MPANRPPSERPSLDSPDVVAAVQKALGSEALQRSIEILTREDKCVRGCMVNSDRAHLQALQEVMGWTIGGYDTRPVEDAIERKNSDRLHVLVTYRQPPFDPAVPPRVAMYDYLCDSLFDIPMRPVGSDVIAPEFMDESGNIVRPNWIEADWEQVSSSSAPIPGLKLCANRYPYQLPLCNGMRAEHWVLWYFHSLGEEIPNPSDDEIGADLLEELSVVALMSGCERFDYIWYRNPAMSVPDMFHVQVFVRFDKEAEAVVV